MESEPNPTSDQLIEESVAKYHPNGRLVIKSLKRPLRDDEPFFEKVFPDSFNGQLLQGLCVTFLIKQEYRMGWARKSACSNRELSPYPNETVASHQWGVAKLITVVSRVPKFQEEMPNFDRVRALEMALQHDVPESITGDITPVDGIEPDAKHQLERRAMDRILSCFPPDIAKALDDIYQTYEERKCLESKFVKDCDKLDFMITGFMLERQGFGGFSEFFTNAVKEGFATNIGEDLAKTVIETREALIEKGRLYDSRV